MKQVLLLFGELNDQDIDWVMAHGIKQELPEGALLVEEGQPVGALYVILNGLFNVTVAARPGAVIRRMAGGEVVGEISFVESVNASATVKALVKSDVLALPRPLVAGRLREDAGFAARFYRALGVVLAYRLRTLNRWQGETGTRADDTHSQLDEEVLGNIHLAGKRFRWMANQLLGVRGASRVPMANRAQAVPYPAPNHSEPTPPGQ
jgi:CRP-like cAMP-binding protein